MKFLNTFTILLFVFIVILIIYVLSSISKTKGTLPYITMTKNGFKGIPINKLAQQHDFYKKNRQTTLTYLNAVYPTGEESLEKLNDLELASFYNSLWFYFNCKGKYKDNDLKPYSDAKKESTKWDSLPCADEFPLPYTPQGHLYNFYTYQKFNVPEVNSDSDDKKEYLKVENASSTRAGFAGTYDGRYARSSGIMWFPPRTVQRNVWYPNGLYNKKSLEYNIEDNWKITVGKTPSYSFPNGWYGKIGDNQYIEVTHIPSDSGDGLVTSPWWWYNVTPGSGLFLFLGKTLAVKNKIAGVFIMLQKLSKTKEGKEFLQKWYKQDNPYGITWDLFGACGYNMNTKVSSCNFAVQPCLGACEPNLIGYGKAAGLKLENFYNETLNLEKKTNPNATLPSEQTIKKAIDMVVNNENYNLAHVAEHVLADETLFFLGLNLDLDTLQLYEDPQGNDNYVFEIIDYRIPEKYKKAAKNRDYSGFMNLKNPNATVQVNENGTWNDPPNTVGISNGNIYKPDVINEYLKNVYENNWLSLRDPFDIYNEKKVSKCTGVELSKVCEKNTENAKIMYCQNSPLLNAYKCLNAGNEFTGGNCILQDDDKSKINC